MYKLPVAIRLLILSLLLFFYTGAHAQGSGSGISGFVYDESGKSIEMATIALANTAMGFTTTTTTDKKGCRWLCQLLSVRQHERPHRHWPHFNDVPAPR